ncbi:MAG: MFS transporter [Chloroflexi bacterium]|nr:MAG: MFS transporter [Chloroflexota bacterium]MBL1195380.1 MFS transporter [Chloroflexota bacterium]NOH12663.1 MFS transporter [Chloroflexota bacterium]
MRTFYTIWAGQLVSTIGSGLTSFALGVWIFERTGSTTLFALSILSFTLPTVLTSPIAGALVDRWNRRWVMVFSDSGAGLSTLVIWLLLASGNLEVWHIYAATVFNAIFTTFQWPAYSAATTMLVDKENLGRAGGMVQIGEAVSQLIAPAVAGALFVTTGLQGIIFLDFATFAFAIVTLLFVRIPQPRKSEEGKEGSGSIWQEAAYGWRYIVARKGLLSLLIYFAFLNFAFGGMIAPLLVPMMLSITEPDKMGYVFSIVGLGMLFGTLIMSAWGGPRRRIIGILGTGFFGGFFYMLLGLRPSLTLIAISGFCILLIMPVMDGSSQALWQSKVAADVQGRVFSVRRMLAQIAQPIAIILAGPLADRVFGPLLLEGGALANSVGRLVGVGPGRGTGLLFMFMGALIVIVSVLAYSYPRLRLVEDELPDAVVESEDGIDAVVQEHLVSPT